MPIFTEMPESINCTPYPQWLDSHCHFDFTCFDPDRDKQWQQLQYFGCAGLVIPGVEANTWHNLIQLCESKPGGYALGLHPYFLEQHSGGDMKRLAELCQQQLLDPSSHLVAIGEFGLDFALTQKEHAKQVEWCQQQFKLAQGLQLPVILHIRKAYDETCAMIRRLGFNQGGIVHAFSGSYQQAEALIKLGFKLGVGGAMSHARATKLRTTISRLPLDCMVLETDSPDMRPAFWKNADNSPVSLLFLAQMVASLHQCSLAEVIFASNNNLLAALPNLSLIVEMNNKV